MLDIDTWQTRYRAKIVESCRHLLPWVLTISDDPVGTDPAMAGETIPDPTVDLDAFVDWKVKYTEVRTVLESALGEDMQMVFAHPLYATVRAEPQCRIMVRIHTIKEILSDLTKNQVATTTPSTTQWGTLPPIIPSLPLGRTTMHAMPVSRPFQSLKRSAASSPTPSSPSKLPRTTLQPLMNTRSPSKSPSIQSSYGSVAGRVFVPPSPITSSQATQLHKERLHAETWGTRCIRCGRIEDRDGHKSFKCQAFDFCASEKGQIVTKFHNKPTRHLEVLSGPLQGTRICGQWNWSRTVNGVCFEPNCSMEHRCTLCFDENHRAIDCEARTYLPKLPPRPASLGPIDVNACLALYTAPHSSSPALAIAGTSRLALTRSQVAMPPPLIPRLPPATLPPSIQPSSLSAQAESSSAGHGHASLARFRLKDAFFDPVGAPDTAAPPTTRLHLPPRVHAPPPSSPIRVDTSLERSSQAQQYHSDVPSMVAIRPGYFCRLTPLDFQDTLLDSDDWLDRFNFLIDHGGETVSVADAALEEQARRDDCNWKAQQNDEVKAKMVAKDWEIARMGLVGDARMQRTDGNPWKSRIALHPHYPPAHPSPHALCANRDGGAMLLSGGLASPSVTGNYQVSMQNLVPVFFDLENGEEGMSIPNPANPAKPTKYKSLAIQGCIDRQATDILDRVEAGASQLYLSFGANPKKAAMQAITTASDSTDYEVQTITIVKRKIRDWEAGTFCLKTMLLRQRHMTAKKEVGPTAALFGNRNFDDAEQDCVKMDQNGIHVAKQLEFKFYLISHKKHPDRCLVMHCADHMSCATDTPGNSSMDIGIKLDVALTLAEDIFFDRFRLGMYPSPSWRFTHRKANSLLVSEKEKRESVHLAGLTEAMVGLVEDFKRFRGTNVSVAALPAKLAKIHQSFTAIEATEGLALDPFDVVDVILAGNTQRLNRFKAMSRSRSVAPSSGRSVAASQVSLSQTQNRPQSSTHAHSSSNSRLQSQSPSQSPSHSKSQSQSQSQPRSSAPVPATPSRHYSALCECGKEYASAFDESGKAVLKEFKITKGGVHPPDAKIGRWEGKQCLMGIPRDEKWLAEALFVPLNRRKPVAQTESARQRADAARAKFVK